MINGPPVINYSNSAINRVGDFPGPNRTREVQVRKKKQTRTFPVPNFHESDSPLINNFAHALSSVQ